MSRLYISNVYSELSSNNINLPFPTEGILLNKFASNWMFLWDFFFIKVSANRSFFFVREHYITYYIFKGTRSPGEPLSLILLRTVAGHVRGKYKGTHKNICLDIRNINLILQVPRIRFVHCCDVNSNRLVLE